MSAPGRIPALPVLLLAIAILAGGAAALAAPPEPAPAAPAGGSGETEEIETVEEVVAVEPVSPASFTPTTLLGRMHPAVVHFPIAWITLLVLLELGILVFRRRELEPWGLALLALTVLSIFPAVASGLLRADELSSAGEDLPLLHWHRNLNLAVCALCLVALVLRLACRKEWRGPARWVYIGLLIVAAGLVTVSGHLGGKMVYGTGYLPF